MTIDTFINFMFGLLVAVAGTIGAVAHARFVWRHWRCRIPTPYMFQRGVAAFTLAVWTLLTVYHLVSFHLLRVSLLPNFVYEFSAGMIVLVLAGMGLSDAGAGAEIEIRDGQEGDDSNVTDGQH